MLSKPSLYYHVITQPDWALDKFSLFCIRKLWHSKTEVPTHWATRGFNYLNLMAAASSTFSTSEGSATAFCSAIWNFAVWLLYNNNIWKYYWHSYII